MKLNTRQQHPCVVKLVPSLTFNFPSEINLFNASPIARLMSFNGMNHSIHLPLASSFSSYSRIGSSSLCPNHHVSKRTFAPNGAKSLHCSSNSLRTVTGSVLWSAILRVCIHQPEFNTFFIELEWGKQLCPLSLVAGVDPARNVSTMDGDLNQPLQPDKALDATLQTALFSVAKPPVDRLFGLASIANSRSETMKTVDAKVRPTAIQTSVFFWTGTI